MPVTTPEQEARFLESLQIFSQAQPLLKPDKLTRLLGQIDALCRSPEGLRFVYHHISELLRSGIFEDTAWAAPDRLVPGLVGGTLLSGHPTSTLELLSELRLLAIAEGQMVMPGYSALQARSFLEDALVAAFDLAFEELTDPSWDLYAQGERQKVRLLFDFLLEKIPLRRLKEKLAGEVRVLVAHQPISPERLEKILRVTDQRIHLVEEEKADRTLRQYVDAFLRPTPLCRSLPDPADYLAELARIPYTTWEEECRQMGEQIRFTGLVPEHLLVLLQYAVKYHPGEVPVVLRLDAHGVAEYERHRAFVNMLIERMIVPATRRAVFGLANVLERNLFSRQITWNAFNRLLRISLHPQITAMLDKSNHTHLSATPIQLLVGGTLSVLGHPLGVRQGNNPTCQSARGISMWSRHAPGKLINLLIDAATANNVEFRYEGEIIQSATTGEGLIRQFDYKLDPVSVVLVPHLDRIYNAMMQRAMIKYPGKDPHVSVNPAFYGHWIQAGFASVYNPLTGMIEDYDRFIRIFYASFHPEFNGGHHLIYPVPLGIFITDAHAVMLGYHAVSLLRVEKDQEGEWRAYFFNPNSEGRQNWGQRIEPSVADRGEKPGESSLPVHQFASRVYAFHYNNIRLGDKAEGVPAETLKQVRTLAEASWGRKYQWWSTGSF